MSNAPSLVRAVRTGSILFVGILVAFGGFFVALDAQASISSIIVDTPTGGTLRGTVPITWTAVGGELGETIDIVYYTTNPNNTTAIPEAINFPFSPSVFNWDTTGLDGSVFHVVISKHGFPAISGESSAFALDNTAPIVSSITSNATTAGTLKVGDSIIFTLTPSSPEPSATVVGSYNGVVLLWSTPDAGVTYTATYTVVEGHADQASPLQIIGVIITDLAGNVSNPASGTDVLKEIDAHSPALISAETTSTTTIDLTFSEDLHGSTPTNADFAVAGFTLGAPDAFEISDGVVRLTVTAPFSTDATPDVDYSGSVTDLAGNVAPSVLALSPTDGVSPVLLEVVAVANPTSSNTPSYTFNSSEAGTISYSGDCSSATTTAIFGDNPITFNALSDGNHINCTISVIDGSSNVSSPLSVAPFVVDATDPVVSVTAPTTVTRTDPASLVITVTDADPAVTCTYDIDGSGGGPIACTGGSITVTDGKHVFNVTATDSAGNVGTSSITAVIDLDQNLTVGADKDFATIQEAVDAAITNDTVAIDTGAYSEAVVISGKDITLTGSGGPVTTTSFALTDTSVSGSTDVSAPTVTVNPGAKIQDGVLLASAGGTVNITSGNYTTTGQVLINKNLTVTGGGATKPVVSPDANLPANNNASSAWFLVNAGVTLNISNLVLDGNGMVVHQGIRSHGTTTIDGVDFSEIRNPSNQYVGFAVAGFGGTVPGGAGSDTHVAGGAASTLTVTNSTFLQIGRIGVLMKGDGLTATLSGNTYTGKGAGDFLDYAFEVGAGGSAIIGPNNVISNNIGVAVSDGSTSAGILVTDYYGTGSDASIVGNTISNSTDGIAVGYDGSDNSVVSAHANKITGTDFGVNSTNPLVDAEQNWWGAASGPMHATNPGGSGVPVSDDVTYSPWCTNEACTTFGSNSPLNHIHMTVSSPVTLPGTSTITITAQDIDHVTRVNETAQVSLTADGGATFGSTLLSFVNGIATTTVTKATAGTVNVTATIVGGTQAATGQVVFEGETLTGHSITWEAKNSFAQADGTFLNGWHYVFKVTVYNEAQTAMHVRFDDWVNNADSGLTVPASPNMRLLINEAGGMVAGVGSESIVENGSGDIKSYALGNAYTDQTLAGVSTPIDISGIDLDTSAIGRQIQFDVFTKIPDITVPGFYSTDYGIQTDLPII